MKHRIYIGFDEREPEAYDVCVHSLERHSSRPLDIRPLKLAELIRAGIYTRTWHTRDGVRVDDVDGRPFSTDFSFSRFLVPTLCRRDKYRAWSMFVDCDFLFTDDVMRLFALADDDYALMCVKHDHRPTETVKMDGQVQSRYGRKNWSSLMLFNMDHPANSLLTQHKVNTWSGRELHGMSWLNDNEIGDLPGTWNHLVTYDQPPADGLPAAIHFTRGGPWFPGMEHVPYADVWCRYRDEMAGDQKRAA